VIYSSDPIADFVVFGDFRSESDDRADKVTSYCHSWRGEDGDVDVLPVVLVSWIALRSMVVLELVPIRWVNRNMADFCEDVVVSKCWHGNCLHFGLAG
jgi:hypothetical protein